MPTTHPRNAIHMPTNFDPMAYEFLDAFDNQAGDPGARGGTLETYVEFGVTVQAFSPVGAAKRALLALLAQSPTSAYEKGGRGAQCDHCGAHIRYVCVLTHTTTGDHICVGETCLDNRVGSMSRATWKVSELRKAAAARAQAERNREAKDAFLASNPEVRSAFERCAAGDFKFDANGQISFAHSTISDIASKFERYGSISERQAAFVLRLAAEFAGRQAETERRNAERAAEVRVAAPTGREPIEGVIISRKGRETDFGYVYKLTIRCTTPEGNFYVWVSEPSSMTTQRGDIVTMTATLTRSDRDESFAFGKRPTGTQIIGTANESDMPSEDSLAAPSWN